MNDAWAKIHARLSALGIDPEDIEEKFTRSRGKGGQNVNKVSTCVVLIHAPSGRMFRCEDERTQARNRLLARKKMADFFENEISERNAREKSAREKVKRQKRGRSKKAKRKMLEKKRRRSEIKKLRRKPGREEL